ncbi:hypothetical protein MK079_04435 [Candidatus Gracilibacteria bacterium]|nr:hypothetical protein [Candidatus Gracilibacteria bacterium]
MCTERNSSYIIDRLNRDKDFFDIKDLEVESCMCTGNCKNGPSVLFDGEIQLHMNPITASDIARGKKQIQKIDQTNQKK